MVAIRAIKPADLEAIDKVLSQRISLREAAIRYDPWLSTLLGVAILYLADHTSISRRGGYQTILEQLVVDPGMPPGGWPPRGFNKPAWANDKQGRRLVDISRTHRWHTSPEGNYGPRQILPPPQLAPFRDIAAYGEWARGVVARLLDGYPAEEPAVESRFGEHAGGDFAAIKEAIEAHPRLQGFVPELLLRCDSASHFTAVLAELDEEFQTLLTSRFPDLFV